MAEAKKKAVSKAKEASKEVVADKKAKAQPKLDKATTVKEKDIDHGNIQEDSQSGDHEAESREVKTAKAGKRSAKALKEAEELEAKAERKVQTVEATEAPKAHQKPARSRLERRGKKFREVAKLVDATKTYSLAEAVELAIKTSPVKFDATVELHVNLNVDPKHADQNVRATVVLPAGTGKTLRVAVLDDTKVAGADLVGVETILQALEKGTVDFDVLIATPAQMPKLGKYARLLGPKGLMPNPKSGTVTTDVAKAVTEAKAGRVEYRVDSTGIVHTVVGKVSFGKEKLLENALAVVASIKSNKPASVKGTYVKVAHLSTTMGPSIASLLE